MKEFSNKIEKNNEPELKFEEKEVLKEAWDRLALGKKTKIDITALSIEETKSWLRVSLMEEIEAIIREWELDPDCDLVEKIRKEEDPEEKSKLELEYIRKCHSVVDKMVEGFDGGVQKSSMWDSWPGNMKKNKEFNCVGGTLIGCSLFEEAKLEHYFGNPHGHAVNIVQLSNGEWWYVDFKNGKENVRKIEPEEVKLAGTKTLKLDDRLTDFRYIPLFNHQQAVASILGNLGTLDSVATEEIALSVSEVEKKEAQEYRKKHEEVFDNTDFNQLKDKLYPERKKLQDTKEMKHEAERIDLLKSKLNITKLLSSQLTKEKKEKIIIETKENIKGIEDYFKGISDMVLEEISQELKEFIELYKKGLQEIEKKNKEWAKEAIENFVERIKVLG